MHSSVETVIEPKSGWQMIDRKEINQYRDLLYMLVLRDITVLYKQTVLGVTWAVIRPVMAMVVFSVIFGHFGKMPSNGIPYPIFSYAALVPWTYFASSVTGSSQSLIAQANIFTKVYFPRLFIPMTPVFSKLVDFGIASLLLAGFMFYFHVSPTLNVVFLPYLIFLMILTAAGLGLWLSALAVQYRDVKHGTEFLMQFMMFAAPVVWPASLIPAKWRFVYGFYPMVGVIEGFRSALLGKTAMPWDLIATGSAGALFLFLSGMFYFSRTERTFADVA